MLTRIQIKNFKKLEDINIELGKSVVLIGPNNSGKTTALQGLVLWDVGRRLWNEKRGGKPSPEGRPGVTINRLDLIPIPIPVAKLLWHNLHVQDNVLSEGKQKTKRVLINIIVEGITAGKLWKCGLEFEYANDESFYCRPLRITDEKKPQRMLIPEESAQTRVVFLPPMSGLAAVEAKSEIGRINVLIGEGQTAQVLRNLCYQIYEKCNIDKNCKDWENLKEHIYNLFGVTLLSPKYIKERGELTMDYMEQDEIKFDLACSGRGLQQTLLLLAYLYANQNNVLLLDEPDAHLEVLRQRQIYQLLTDVALKQGSQIVAASHSEVILNEAADRDIVIAFVGKPHRIDDTGSRSQVSKSLREIGFDHYYLAEQTGWILYLEGSTDLEILRKFAEVLKHDEAQKILEKPFVHYVANNTSDVKKHFWGLKEAKQDLVGIAIFDRLDKSLPNDLGAIGFEWKKRELENYFCMEEVLITYARDEYKKMDDLFDNAEADYRETAMRESILEISSALKTLKRIDPWSKDIKATDDFLDPLFEKYFEKLGLPNLLRKSSYHVLASLVPKDKIEPEIIEKLDAIVEISKKAKPKSNY